MRVLLGVTGGIAAYKAASLVRLYAESGHEVQVIATENALRFIGEPTLAALSGNKVYSSLYESSQDVPHIELAQWAEIVVVAPATAAFIARYASGNSDDLLINVLLATTARVFIAPAMHTEMWAHEATKTNVETLRSRGISFVEPAVGRLTGNDTGPGRLAEPETIYAETVTAVGPLSGVRALVTAGGTIEPIDEVRFIGNRSSGKQGLAFANQLQRLGAQVTVIGANLSVTAPAGVTFIRVSTYWDLATAIQDRACDFLVMAAAVSDFSVEPSSSKLSRQNQQLKLLANDDLLAAYAKKHPETICLGFAAETVAGDELILKARQKLASKGIPWIVANDVSSGIFGAGETSAILVSAKEAIPFDGSKENVARAILESLIEHGVIGGQ